MSLEHLAGYGWIIVAALLLLWFWIARTTAELRATNQVLARARDELRELAITDPLTGCHNRRFFREVIGRELHRRRRYRHPLSLVFIDVDRFKAVNDAFGHDAGDQALREVAAFLRRHVREADYLFRWGGDEFLILMSCRLDQARRRGRALKAAFAHGPEVRRLPTGLALSVGCAELPDGVKDVMPLVEQADQRMFEDKRAARGPRPARLVRGSAQ